MERQNPNKKQAKVIIKTIKRGKTISNEKFEMTGGIGKQLSQEQLIFEKKFIDYSKIQFPEKNPVDLTST